MSDAKGKPWREKLARPDRVTAYVTPEEHKQVKIAAIEEGTDTSGFIRRLMAARLGWPREEEP